MNTLESTLSKIALRYFGIYVDTAETKTVQDNFMLPAPVLAFTRRLAENGYTLSEEALHALASVDVKYLIDVSSIIGEVYRVELNWAPLVRDFDNGVEQTGLSYVVTMLSNLLGPKDRPAGVTLPCGHFIPDGIFPLERYNGCPYCGTPFMTVKGVMKSGGGSMKILRLMTRTDMESLFVQLLTSPVPLDATQLDSLKQLLQVFDVPDNIEVPMKESLMAVVDSLVAKGLDEAAGRYLTMPTELLRYLWYRKTGRVEIIRPATFRATAFRWNGILPEGPYPSIKIQTDALMSKLKLKYRRSECRRAARWLNAMCADARRMAEDIHPYREMWVRFIRALRLSEFAAKPGYEHLAEFMDVFYRRDYTVWAGRLDAARRERDSSAVFEMLKMRPGYFARCLFATMLRFGATETLSEFGKVAMEVPPRLLLSLLNGAESYFDPAQARYVGSITGDKTMVEHNPLLSLYSAEELREMTNALSVLYLDVMGRHFALETARNAKVYIDPRLYDIPVGVGDRATTIQDASCALQGTRFEVEGDKVRVFLQWGKGMPAQYLDMDLSARIYYQGRTDMCFYGNLKTVGAQHSGDIRSIPDRVGTAEYVDLDLRALAKAGARYVAFVCNAYSAGRLPELIVGWMNSKYPMKVSEETGVAYDPSCVQHMVRVSESNLAKGMTFGVLDVASRRIVWLELLDQNQAAFQGDAGAVTAFLDRLRRKVSVGQLLEVRARAQNVDIVDSAEQADKAYTYEWALNPANVAELLG